MCITDEFYDNIQNNKASNLWRPKNMTQLKHYRKISGQQTFKGTHQSEQADFGPRSK